jgi:hypothetical protein
VILFNIDAKPSTPKPVIARDWKKYDAAKSNEKLGKVDRTIEASTVQAYWNAFEDKLINVIDDVLPYVTTINCMPSSNYMSRFIKNKINKRKRNINSTSSFLTLL